MRDAVSREMTSDFDKVTDDDARGERRSSRSLRHTARERMSRQDGVPVLAVSRGCSRRSRISIFPAERMIGEDAKHQQRRARL